LDGCACHGADFFPFDLPLWALKKPNRLNNSREDKTMLRLMSLLTVFLLVLVVSAHGTEYTGTVTGHVVSARNVNQNLDGVVVTNDRTADTALVQSGTYSLTLPIGDVTLGFTDETEEFVKVRMAVTVPLNGTLECNLAMIPVDIDPPASVMITPINPIVLVDEIKPFEGHCYAANGAPVSLSPVWSLLEGPDSEALDWATGILAPKQIGPYSIMASVGAVKALQRIEVSEGPRPRCLYVGNNASIETFILDLGYETESANQVWQSHYASSDSSIFDSFDVVVIDEARSVIPEQRNTIKDYLMSGGGVVLTKDVPYTFSSTKAGNVIYWDEAGDWLGVTSCYDTLTDSGTIYIVDNNPFGLPLNTDTMLLDSSAPTLMFEAPSFDSFTRPVAGRGNLDSMGGRLFAYTHTYGSGRLYYQAEPDGFPNYPWVIQLFGSGLNWAAGRI
jgi:hypothetical protein